MTTSTLISAAIVLVAMLVYLLISRKDEKKEATAVAKEGLKTAKLAQKDVRDLRFFNYIFLRSFHCFNFC